MADEVTPSIGDIVGDDDRFYVKSRSMAFSHEALALDRVGREFLVRSLKMLLADEWQERGSNPMLLDIEAGSFALGLRVTFSVVYADHVKITGERYSLISFIRDYNRLTEEAEKCLSSRPLNESSSWKMRLVPGSSHETPPIQEERLGGASPSAS